MTVSLLLLSDAKRNPWSTVTGSVCVLVAASTTTILARPEYQPVLNYGAPGPSLPFTRVSTSWLYDNDRK